MFFKDRFLYEGVSLFMVSKACNRLYIGVSRVIGLPVLDKSIPAGADIMDANGPGGSLCIFLFIWTKDLKKEVLSLK